MSEEAEVEIKDESLTEIFDGEAEIPEEISEEAESTGETEEEAAADETKAEETEETAPPAEEDKPDYEAQLKAQVAKSKDERQKRQNAQKENEGLRHQLAEKQVVPDAFAEPDKAIEHSSNQVLQSVDDRFYNMSEFHAKRNHNDYAEKADIFFEVLQHQNPSLANDARNAPDICEFIYETAKNHVDMAEMNDAGGVQQLIDKKVAEAKLEWEAGQSVKDNQAVEDKITASIPGSLSGKRASGSNKAVIQTEDKPLDKLF